MSLGKWCMSLHFRMCCTESVASPYGLDPNFLCPLKRISISAPSSQYPTSQLKGNAVRGTIRTKLLAATKWNTDKSEEISKCFVRICKDIVSVAMLA